MDEVPVHVSLSVGDRSYNLTVVGDPNDVMFAYDVGYAVQLAVLGVVEEQS